MVLEWVLIGGAIVAASALLAGGAIGYSASQPKYAYYYPGYGYYPGYYWVPRPAYFIVPQ
ncbi:hypothetical protein AC481_02425 [miscellaneous Crenarchaeota group archaeon SMTZ-80]|nr:MAG: hypothetical protein AC481_02425 [miscellaneous Crenarchaeota group archaeon SMTZ-80]